MPVRKPPVSKKKRRYGRRFAPTTPDVTTYKKPKLRCHPFPEAVTGDTWKVKHGPPSISLENRTLSIPLDEDHKSFHLRRHEVGRAHFFPTPVRTMCGDNIEPETMLSVQDAALNTAVHRVLNDIPAFWDNEVERDRLHTRIANIDNIRDRLTATVSLIGTEGFDQMYGRLPKREQVVLDKAVNELDASYWSEAGFGPTELKEYVRGDCVSPKHTATVAAWLDAMFDVLEHEDEAAEAQGKGTPSDPSAAQEAAQQAIDDDPHSARKKMEEMRAKGKLKRGTFTKQAEYMGGAGIPGEGASDDMSRAVHGWFPTKFHKPTLTQRLPGKKMGRRKIAQDYGVVPRNIHRWATDKRIFSRVLRGKGAGVAIDCSGSMRVPHDLVYKLLTLVPQCEVIIYCGARTDDDGLNWGHITIIAENGRCATEQVIADHRFGGDNACDGLALRWLANVNGPKLWVSDGGVTGMAGYVELLMDVSTLCACNNIKRVDSVADAITFFEKGGHLK